MTTPIETAKRNAAQRAVDEHFSPEFQYVGIGSGSTIVYVVDAIRALNVDVSKISFVPTGNESRKMIVKAGLTPITLDSLPADVLLDVAFDGADEVDEELNCIKGGGACLYQEKLVAMQAQKFVCVADHRKLVPRLLTSWPSIPIEVEPLAAARVLRVLRVLGSPSPSVRDKDGPIKTDQDNFIVDAPFPTLLTAEDLGTSEGGNGEGKGDTKGKGKGKGENGKWEVQSLAREIKLIQGVLEVGLFFGRNGVEVAADGEFGGGQKPVAAYFGMTDGSVVVREAKKKS